MVTPDKILSYWILLWYILFIFKIIYINPKFILIVGLFENLMLLFLILDIADTINIFYFLIIIFITKIIPILTLWNCKIKLVDIYYTIGIVCVYVIWLYVTNSIYNPITKFTNSIKNNKPEFPGMIILHYLFDKYLYKRS